jgi:hypothetical protein
VGKDKAIGKLRGEIAGAKASRDSVHAKKGAPFATSFGTKQAETDAIYPFAEKADTALPHSATAAPPHEVAEQTAAALDANDFGALPARWPSSMEADAAKSMDAALDGLSLESKRGLVNAMSHGALTMDAANAYMKELPPEMQASEATRLQVLGGLKPHQQQRFAKAYSQSGHAPPELLQMAREVLTGIDKRRGEIKGERRRLVEEEEYLKLEQKADRIALEIATMGDDPRLQRLTETGYHKLVEAFADESIVVPGAINPEILDTVREVMLGRHDPGIFVVQHDWAAAMKNATDFEGGEWHTPYPNTVFEFRVSGHRVILTIGARGENGIIESNCIVYIETKSDGWVMFAGYEVVNGDLVHAKNAPYDVKLVTQRLITDLCWKQVRAVCISLEAEVATTSVVAAPHKLNSKRERHGKLPIYEYHVVDLAHRKRYAPVPVAPGDIEDERRHRRLHAVRGHWRHYTNRKVWIKWHFRGDPDLGFIDKEYRL